MSLYIFDKDGTLLKCERNTLHVLTPPLTCEEQVLLPGVFEKVAELRAAGHRLAIASNQPVVAKGVLSLSQAKQLMENCAAKLGGVDAWRLSPYDPHAKKKLDGQANPYARDDPSRKPHPGMIMELMSLFGVSEADVVMVGNASHDRKAAKAAGVRYETAHRFFKY